MRVIIFTTDGECLVYKNVYSIHKDKDDDIVISFNDTEYSPVFVTSEKIGTIEVIPV